MSNEELGAIINRLNPGCRQALEQAAGLCQSRGHFTIEIEHWLLKLLDQDHGDLSLLLPAFDIEPARLAADLNLRLEKRRTGNDQTPTLSPNLIRLAREAWLKASLDFSESRTRSVSLLLALLESETLSLLGETLSPLLARINSHRLRAGYHSLLAESAESAESDADNKPRPAPASSGKQTGALEQFTTDLTAQASSGKIDPVIGREKEIRQVIDILTRRRQNNPILAGEPGVGKTAVVEGFALKIARGEVPDSLRDVSVRVLDMGLLQAGAGVKGEFENRLKNVIRDIQQATQPVILFVDEAHTLIGAGGAAGQNDAANLLKPALARGELRTVAATTWAEYKQYFEKDAALTRRFQVVKVEEPAQDDAVRMLRGIAANLARHHQVRILDEAVRAAVSMSARYIPGRQLPDKAISLLDTACARVAISQATQPGRLDMLEAELHHLGTEIRMLENERQLGAEHQAQLSRLREKRQRCQTEYETQVQRWHHEKAQLEALNECRQALEAAGDSTDDDALAGLKQALAQARESLEQLQGEQPLIHDQVDQHTIASVIADWTGIPVGRMQSDEIERVLRLSAALRQRVVGQDPAVEAIARTIHASRAQLTDPGRPIGVFLLVGPSGVGKTETALALAEQLYGSDQNITTINMSEYKEEHKVSLMLGSPPGYVGYGEGGVLTEAVRRQPYSVLLLDEMEKAHPGIQDIFYQIFDKGRVKDGEGREIDFRNTLIIMTSNAGSDLITQFYADPARALDAGALKQPVYQQLQETFKPAFLGRTEIVPYAPLSEPILADITRLKLRALASRLEQHYQAELAYDETLLEAITARCDEAGAGARNIQRVLAQQLLPDLSVRCLERLAQKRPFACVRLGFSREQGFSVAFEPRQAP